MSFEVKTPALMFALDLVKQSMTELDAGAADIKTVNAKLNGARTVQNIVKTEVTTRLSEAKIHAQEARTINNASTVVITDQTDKRAAA